MRPQDSDLCAHCNDPFGSHYITFNGAVAGCVAYLDKERNTRDICLCNGFLIAYNPQKHDKPPGPTLRRTGEWENKWRL
jgi:hypothetical protein